MQSDDFTIENETILLISAKKGTNHTSAAPGKKTTGLVQLETSVIYFSLQPIGPTPRWEIAENTEKKNFKIISAISTVSAVR